MKNQTETETTMKWKLRLRYSRVIRVILMVLIFGAGVTSDKNIPIHEMRVQVQNCGLGGPVFEGPTPLSLNPSP